MIPVNASQFDDLDLAVLKTRWVLVTKGILVKICHQHSSPTLMQPIINNEFSFYDRPVPRVVLKKFFCKFLINFH